MQEDGSILKGTGRTFPAAPKLKLGVTLSGVEGFLVSKFISPFNSFSTPLELTSGVNYNV